MPQFAADRMPAGYDFAIAGATPLAGLLAGLLARDHGKRVVRVGRRPSAQRLPRGLDLGFVWATRPQSWELLERGVRETLPLLRILGPDTDAAAADTTITADIPATANALSHIAHMAAGYGVHVGHSADRWTFRGLPLLRAETVEDRLERWLATLHVAQVGGAGWRLDFENSGAARLMSGEETIEADQVVLADDAALLELPEAMRPPMLSVHSVMATLTGATARLPSPVMWFADRGVTLAQRSAEQILAWVSGDTDAELRLASAFAGPFPIRRLATSRYRRVTSRDGAPLIGRLKTSRVFVMADLGSAAAFFAPPLARLLAGAAEGAEKRWLLAHDPSREREPIAETAP